MGSIGTSELAVLLAIAVVVALVGVLPFWFICKKAGLSPWLSLIMMIPFGALVLPFVLAFIDWPALRGDRPTFPPS
jgi:branched-subunit amino acid transport protein AzlD